MKKRLLAVVLAVAMVLGMTVAVSADESANEVNATIAFYETYDAMSADRNADLANPDWDTGLTEFCFDNATFTDTFTLTLNDPQYIGTYILGDPASYGIDQYGKEFLGWYAYPENGYCDGGDNDGAYASGAEMTYVNSYGGSYPVVRLYPEFAEYATSENDFDVSVQYMMNGTDITDTIKAAYDLSYTSFTVYAGETTGYISLPDDYVLETSGITLPDDGTMLTGWTLTATYGKFYDAGSYHDTVEASGYAEWRTTTEALPTDDIVVTATAVFQPATTLTVEIDNTDGAIADDVYDLFYSDLSSCGDRYYNDPTSENCYGTIALPAAQAPTVYGSEYTMQIVSGWTVSKILDENGDEIDLTNFPIEVYSNNGILVGEDITATYAAEEGSLMSAKFPTDSMAYTVVLKPTVEPYVEEIAEWEITVNVYESYEDKEDEGNIFKTKTLNGTDSIPTFKIFSGEYLTQCDLGLDATGGEVYTWITEVTYDLDDGAETGVRSFAGDMSVVPQSIDITMNGHTKGVFNVSIYPYWTDTEGTLIDAENEDGDTPDTPDTPTTEEPKSTIVNLGNDAIADTEDDTDNTVGATSEGNVIVNITAGEDKVPDEGEASTPTDPDVDIIYSVEIIWGDMTFEWKAPTVWNAETHTYELAEGEEEWMLVSNSALADRYGDALTYDDGTEIRQDSVVVYNHSNSPVNVAFAVTETADDAVTASIDNAGGTIAAAIVGEGYVYNNATRAIATVSLDGTDKTSISDWFTDKSNDGATEVTVAKVTVTITKAE